MLDEQAKENVRKDIQTILKTAIVVDSTLDEYGSELCERLDDPKEVMQHVRTACEMLEVWEPERNRAAN